VKKFSKYLGIGAKSQGPEGRQEASAGTEGPQILGDAVEEK
jgi:hypothetical protein